MRHMRRIFLLLGVIIIVNVCNGNVGDDSLEEDDIRNRGKAKTNRLQSMMKSASQLGLLNTASNGNPSKPKTGVIGSMFSAGDRDADLRALQAQTERDRAKDGKWRKMLSSQVTPERAFKTANYMTQFMKRNSKQ